MKAPFTFLAVWAELDAELANHAHDLNLSFGLEYSDVVDWVADLTPRRNHPLAREYGNVWRGQGNTAAAAISHALRQMRAELSANVGVSR